jgi:hypothetical protein
MALFRGGVTILRNLHRFRGASTAVIIATGAAPKGIEAVTLLTLFESHGYSSSQVGAGVGITPRLFDSIDKGRQPLPLGLARQVALFLGEEVATVIIAAGLYTESTDPLTLVPLPPDPLLGDAIVPMNLLPGGGPILPPPILQHPRLLLIGNDVSSGNPGAVAIRRNTGAVETAITLLAGVDDILDAAVIGTAVWVFGGGHAIRLDRDAVVALNLDTVGSAYTSTTGVTYSPEAGLWVADGTGGGAIQQVDQSTGVALQTVAVSAVVRDVLAVGNRLYATTGAELREINPSTGATLRTTVLRAPAAGIAYDGVGELWVVVGGGTPGLFRVPLDTFVDAEVTITGTTPGDFRWLEWAGGVLWISELGVARLLRVSPSGAVLETRTFPGTAAGRVALPGGIAWYANPGDGAVRGLPEPTVVVGGIICATYVVGGAASVVVSL